MASSPRDCCSPLDIYLGNIDTSRILIAKTFAERLPGDDDLITILEDCFSNSVTATYRHDSVDQIAIILFQYPITDIGQCQDELNKSAPDVFVFEIEPNPHGLVVINSADIDPIQLNSYIDNRKSGIGSEARPEVLSQQDVFLIVRVRRNIEKVLRKVVSRSHSVAGQPVYFEPYFPCFHDTLTELLSSSHLQKTVKSSSESTVSPGTPYPDTEPDQCSPWQDPRTYGTPRFPGRRHSFSPEDDRSRSGSSDDGRRNFDGFDSPDLNERRGGCYNSPGSSCHDDTYPEENGEGEDYYHPPRDREQGDYYHPPGDGERGGCYYPPGDGGRDDYYRPSEDGDDYYHPPGDGDDYYHPPGDGGRDDYYHPPRVRGRDGRSYSPGQRRWPESFEEDLEEDGEERPHRRGSKVTGNDDRNGGKKQTIQIKSSSICDDDEEEKIVSVCLESPIGKQFLERFRKANNCEIDVKFKKKAIQQKRSDTIPSRKTDIKSTHDVAVKAGQRASCNKQIILRDPNLLALGLIQPSLWDQLEEVFADQDQPNRHSRGRTTDRSDTIHVNKTKLTIKKGDVSREKAEVLVNVVGENLELQESLISKSYAKRGGDELQQAYQIAMTTYDGKGTIVCDGGKLACSHLITMVLAQRKDSASDQNFSVTLQSVFQKAAEIGCGTIALPLMGCGKMLKYPVHTAIAITMDTTRRVLKSSKNNFKEVTVVAFDDSTYDELAKDLRGKGTAKPQTGTSQSHAPKETVGCSIELSACGSSKVQRLRTELTKAIKTDFLSTNTVRLSTSMSLRTKAKLYGIVDEHVKMPMKLEFEQSGTHVALKGEFSQVSKTERHLKSMLSKGDSSDIRKAMQCSPSSWYNLAHVSPVSPPYWTNFKANTDLTVLSKTSRLKRWSLVPVDRATSKAIEKLVQSTWAKELVGQGRDAVNLHHKQIQVDKVERIENIDVYSKYAAKRQEHFRMLAEQGTKTLKSLKDTPVQTKGAIRTSLKDGSVLYDDIFPEINEHYLFHGTKPDIIQTVLQQGLDCRMSNEKAMLGMGIYGAETSTKADQYVDHKQQRSPGSKTMLLVRMLLGNMFVCKDQNPTKYRRPPCVNTRCGRDNCTSNHGHFDSVVGDGPFLFREFVVYAAEQCCPEYLITYHRK